ncbi:PucR family transcriptional regulator [Paenibacillus xanthanilyticus]|uniref:PucR family transcriptional regulator n=1 Tax=Paenibacillus xanthanilyticus TaxID=1783531 RepID=A0ABV8K5D3_9BACL
MLLSDLLEIPMLKSTRVVAGGGDLHRAVLSVNMMDSPDIFDYLKPHELLLTTAYAIKDQPDILIKLVQEMAALGCAGLGIKTKRYLDEIPAEAKAEADRLHFPLLELSLDCSLAEALHQMLSRILEYRTEEMRCALERHRKFSDIILEGKGLQDMIDVLAELLGAPVLLVSANSEAIAQSKHFQQAAYTRASAELQSRLPSLAPGSKAVVIDLPYTASRWVCHPIVTDQPHGCLLTLGGLEHDESDALASLTAEQAVNVISFELMKRQAVKERSRRYKYDFFADVVDGRIASEQEMLHRGGKYGFKGDCAHLCISIAPDPPQSGDAPKTGNVDKERLYELVKREAKSEGLTFVLFVKHDGLVMLLPSAEGPRQDPLEAEYELSGRLKRIGNEVFARGGVSISFGIGNAADTALMLPRAYQESVEALNAGRRGHMRRFVQFYRVKELNDLLRMLPQADIAEFVLDTFRRLNQLEEKERLELLRTLRAYFDNHCNIADTAKQLFVHRNTVIYRLDKCEQLTGRSLRSVTDSLRFRVAFQMDDVMNASHPQAARRHV